MNKAELIEHLSEKVGLSKKEAKGVLETVLNEITGSLIRGEDVALAGFGNFTVKAKPERTGRNPLSGEAITISARNAPVFKAGKALKDSVN
jgi:DNA-binding protein HU-beta